jgi:hypothetical protein
MDMGTCAEVRWREGVVIVESECGWWVIIRAGVRSFVKQVGQGPGCRGSRGKKYTH